MLQKGFLCDCNSTILLQVITVVCLSSETVKSLAITVSIIFRVATQFGYNFLIRLTHDILKGSWKFVSFR